MGGGLTKSAYYVIYISEAELQATSRINENRFEPNVQNYAQSHPYGSITAIKHQVILKKVLDDNQKLVHEIDEFNASDLAKRVTTLYERSYDEIVKVTEQKLSQKEMGSIYIYLMSKAETKDLGMRMLLDYCFFAEAKDRIHTIDKSYVIIQKLQEKANAKKNYYSHAKLLIDEADQALITQHSEKLRGLHMDYLLQSLVLEKMNEGNTKDSLALMNHQVHARLAQFQSD